MNPEGMAPAAPVPRYGRPKMELLDLGPEEHNLLPEASSSLNRAQSYRPPLHRPILQCHTPNQPDLKRSFLHAQHQANHEGLTPRRRRDLAQSTGGLLRSGCSLNGWNSLQLHGEFKYPKIVPRIVARISPPNGPHWAQANGQALQSITWSSERIAAPKSGDPTCKPWPFAPSLGATTSDTTPIHTCNAKRRTLPFVTIIFLGCDID